MCFALEEYENPKITHAGSLKELMQFSDVVIGAIPMFDSKGNVFTTFSDKKINISELLEFKGKKIVTAELTEEINKLINKSFEILLLDNLEEFKNLRGIITSEGVIKLLIEETDFTLENSNVLIYGYGGTGKNLAKKLKAMGCFVTVAVRRNEIIAKIAKDGFIGTNIKEVDLGLNKYDIIINTVEKVVLDSSNLKNVNKNAVLVDLYEKKGGIDKKECMKQKLKLKWSLSIPAISAPLTYSNIIAEIIKNINY